VAANAMPAHPPPSGLRIELEDAQLLVAAAGLRDARGPRDSLLARGQFEHGEAAVEWGCPRVATLDDCAVSRDEHGRHVFVDAAPEDVDASGLFALLSSRAALVGMCREVTVSPYFQLLKCGITFVANASTVSC